MRRDILLYFLIATAVVLTLLYYMKAAGDCEARGGVLVKGAFDMPACVAGAPR